MDRQAAHLVVAALVPHPVPEAGIQPASDRRRLHLQTQNARNHRCERYPGARPAPGKHPQQACDRQRKHRHTAPELPAFQQQKEILRRDEVVRHHRPAKHRKLDCIAHGEGAEQHDHRHAEAQHAARHREQQPTDEQVGDKVVPPGLTPRRDPQEVRQYQLRSHVPQRHQAQRAHAFARDRLPRPTRPRPSGNLGGRQCNSARFGGKSCRREHGSTPEQIQEPGSYARNILVNRAAPRYRGNATSQIATRFCSPSARAKRQASRLQARMRAAIYCSAST